VDEVYGGAVSSVSACMYNYLESVISLNYLIFTFAVKILTEGSFRV
jgi:hypothetical protein